MDFPYVSSLTPAGGGSGATWPYVEYTLDESNRIIGVKFYFENAIPASICDNFGNLQTVDFSKSINIKSIGFSAFRGCMSLASIDLPSGITSIDRYAFSSCLNLVLTELPSGITIISDYTFSSCSKLALTELPSEITSIGTYAFNSCTGLTSLTFKGTPTSIANNAFPGCTNLLDIYVPWSNGAVAGAPWGATNATIHYDSVV